MMRAVADLLIAPLVLGADSLGERLQDFLSAPGFAPVAIAVALAAGALHTLAPGHGKSLAAAYLVGTEGKVRDALWMGGSVALMHTFSCLVLAATWTFSSLSDLVAMRALTTGLQLAAGVLITATGIWLLRRHLRTARHGHGSSPSRPDLILLGISGAAFLVLGTGFFTGQAGALVMAICFGLGLAAVLLTVGLLAVSGRHVVARPRSLVRPSSWPLVWPPYSQPGASGSSAAASPPWPSPSLARRNPR